MAGYKTHISIGAVVALAMVVLTNIWGMVSGISLAVLVFIAGFLGAFLPDLDSETGKPFKIIFTTYGLVAAALTLYFLVESDEEELLLVFTIPLLVFMMVRFVFSLVFRKLTIHRGMFHSIPAALIAFAGTYFLFYAIGFGPTERFALALSAFVGFISHLALDELFSTNILNGEWAPKRSLGTAMKFFAKNKRDNIIAYGILFFFIIMNLFVAILKSNNPN